MLRRLRLQLKEEGGDTLIEVTFALAILGFVLLGSMAIAATAFRTGQTARERTQIATEAQQQMEALRSFRDNHDWANFRGGAGCSVAVGAYCGVDQVLTQPCDFDAARRCFHMELMNMGGSAQEWTPRPGSMTGSVPTSVIEITTSTPSNKRACGYDFELHYSFEPLGGGVEAANRITTRLANLKYDKTGAAADCL